MLKRVYEVIAVMLLLAGLGGMVLSFQFLYTQRFIEGGVAGVLAFILLRSGLLVLRLVVARDSLAESHRKIMEHLGEGPPKGERWNR